MNVGVTVPLMVMSTVAVVAQPDDDGVKVYVVVPVADVFIVAGLHVPLIPLVDVNSNGGAVEPWHKGPICAKTGVI